MAVLRSGHITQHIVESQAARAIRTITPINLSRRIEGTIQVDLSLESLDREFAAHLRRWLEIGVGISFCVALILGLLIRQQVLKPVAKLVAAVKAMSQADRIGELEVTSTDELGELTSAFNKMTLDLRAAESRVTYLAYHDSLTGLANRRLFMNRLQHVISNVSRYQCSAALIYIDLDGFKQINDSLGHAKGDAVLREAARRLSESTRDADTVARIGGDEFVILINHLPESTDEHHPIIDAVADKVQAAFVSPMNSGNESIMVHASVGIRVFGPEDRDGAVVLNDADRAMYQAKAEGRNRIYKFAT